MTARITYNSVNVDFDIKYDSLEVSYTQNRNQNRSLSGKTETINLHGIMQINFQTVLAASQYRDMVGFYSWARQGKTFSFAPHSSLTGNATLNGNATESLIPVTTTGGFSTGDYCMIRAADDDEFEIVQISGLTGTGASVSSTLMAPGGSGRVEPSSWGFSRVTTCGPSRAHTGSRNHDRSMRERHRSPLKLAGQAGLEPATAGFGDRCSTN